MATGESTRRSRRLKGSEPERKKVAATTGTRGGATGRATPKSRKAEAVALSAAVEEIPTPQVAPAAQAAALVQVGGLDSSAQVVQVQVEVAKEDGGRPLATLVARALKAGEKTLRVPKNLSDSRKVPITSSLLLESVPGSLLPPVLRLPGLVVAGAGTVLTLRYLSLEFSPEASAAAGAALIEVRQGASVELIDCRLQGAGLLLHGAGASAHLVRTRIAQTKGPGVTGSEFADLALEGCQVVGCAGEGVRATSGRRLNLLDCTVTDNELSGLLVDGASGIGHISGCTISRNGQYGVCADSGALLTWGQNSLSQNALGETGGRGQLEGWRSGASFRAGDECRVWVDSRASWLPGRVKSASGESLTVTYTQVGAESGKKLAASPGAPARRVWSKTKDAPKAAKAKAKQVETTVRLDS
ncbi:unnamed protein product, partial [Polarella glacialis]